MISKKKAFLGAIVIIIITSILSFSISNVMQIRLLGSKTAVPNKELQELTEVHRKYSKLIALENYISDNYLNEVTDEEILDGELKGLFESLDDPYSVYMTSDEFKSFMEHTKGTYGGIGIIVTPGEDNLITVVSPIEDTPGERSGIKSGDKIIKVNGEEFFADNMDEAIKHMKGKPGTDVTLTIFRKEDGKDAETLDIKITRQEIRLKSVKSKMLSNKIGYIRLIQFDELVYTDFMKHLKELQKQGMKGLVIDLRNNPGGLLDKCVDIADELIGKSTIVYTETKHGEKEYEKSDASKIDIPYVLLVNEGSASASEILAGAVKDTKSGTLIGTKTFGKGIVQRIKQIPADGSGFKLTVSKYFTPNGTSIHGIGITPDIVIEIPEDVEKIGADNIEDDTQLKKAIQVLKEKMK